MYKRLQKLLGKILAYFMLMVTFSANADVFSDILNQLEKQTDFQDNIQHVTDQLPDWEQQTIHQLMNTAGLDMSTQDYNPHLQSWGSKMDQWRSVLTAYQQDNEGLSGIAKNLHEEFPIQPNSVANPDPNSIDAKYYDLASKTALATRAASQYDYDNIQKQMTYLHNLLSLIPKTKTVKDAMDLQNRIQIEGSLIQLEVLRLSALNNQQQAIQAQGEVNAIVNNANTFE